MAFMMVRNYLKEASQIGSVRTAFQKNFVKVIGKHLQWSSVFSKGAGVGRCWRSIIENIWTTASDFWGADNQLSLKI